MFDFPTFESTFTDEDLDEPPKVSTFGKPSDLKLFEKKCFELLKRKPPVKSGQPPANRRGRRNKRKLENPQQPPKKKKKKRKERKAWLCAVCKVWHGRSDNFKCPKKAKNSQA